MKCSLLVVSLIIQSTIVLADLLPVHINAPTAEHFREIVRNDTYDFGCRPIARRTEDGQFTLHALLTKEQIAHLKKEYDSDPNLSIHRQIVKRDANAPIGSGDRFKSGSITPIGLGTNVSATTISSIMTPTEISSAVQGLVNCYRINTIALPYTTYDGVNQIAAYVGGGSDKSNYHLYLSAGMHARERGGPDNLIYWISDLLAANESGSGLTYGKKTYTNAQVESVLSAGIVFFPLVNPDGVAYDQSYNNKWRKNRNKDTGSSVGAIGVDINRNFDFLWDFPKHFSESVTPASTDPSKELFYGTAAASESETKNHVSIYDSFPNIRWFMDIHNHAGEILYSWGDDVNQSNDTTMNFLNSAYDGKRGAQKPTVYGEYIPSTDEAIIKSVAFKTADAMMAVAGNTYEANQAIKLTAGSGASDDYAFSRYWAKPGVNKVYGYTMEFGVSGMGFYPTLSEFNQNILDTNAGLMDWSLAAIAVGLK